MTEPYKKECYLTLALDPIHPGAGGYRLGRIDNTIVRESGTGVPKIPAGSISGVCRAYTAMQTNRYPDCAGKGEDYGESHCGQCEVCLTYGFSKGKINKSFQGLAQFFDARIAFFPVRSMRGPVWITCPSELSDLNSALEKKFIVPDEPRDPNDPTKPVLQTDIVPEGSSLNLGRLMLKNQVNRPPMEAFPEKLPKIVRENLVLIPNRLFPNIINSNLEVRTSVAINPKTGAADEGALFTYEAIPRATVLWFEVVYNKPEMFNPPLGVLEEIGDAWKKIEWVKGQAELGIDLMEVFGVGGMGTRGMGRLKRLKESQQEAPQPMVPQEGNLEKLLSPSPSQPKENTHKKKKARGKDIPVGERKLTNLSDLGSVKL